MAGFFRLRLLGTVQVERDGELMCGFGSQKALALLGYLAVQDHPLPRAQLADLLWEDKSEARGRANLSWVLHVLSARLPGCLRADRHTVQFQGGAAYWLDTDAFEDLRAQDGAASLAAAVALYRGEFLNGLSLRGCPEFEMWLVGERERWRQRVAGALRELVGHHRRRGEFQQSLHFAQRLLGLEPWREEMHREVMQLLAYDGQRGAALAQYASCRRILADTLGVEPAEETRRLYEQIRDGALESPASPLTHLRELPARPVSRLAEEEAAARPVIEPTRQRHMNLSAHIIQKAKSAGASLAGIASLLELGRSPSHQERGLPQRWPAEASVLVLALEHSLAEPQLDWWGVLGGTPGNRRLGAISESLCGGLWAEFQIEAQTLPYQPGIFLKDAAVLAGLGVIGANNLLVTPEFGPRVRLRALLLGRRLTPTGPLDFSPCETCTRPCWQACPRQAFIAGAYERGRCQAQMAADEAKPVFAGKHQRDRLPIPRVKYCRACELACPVGGEDS